MREFKYHCLMIKTHTKTNLKYLCKKSTNNIEECFTYRGSGTYWKRHLKQHGNEIKTEIIECCSTRTELTQKGIEWSRKLNVVASEQFANLVEERGDGGPTFLGRKHTPAVLQKRAKRMKQTIANMTPDQRECWRQNNKRSHELYVYITPKGEYTDMEVACTVNNVSMWELRCRCRLYTGKTIQGRRFIKHGWVGRTWKDLGWDYRLNT